VGARKRCFENVELPSVNLTYGCLCPLRAQEDVCHLCPCELECSPPALTSVKTISHAKVRAGRRFGRASSLLGSFRVLEYGLE